MSQYILNCERGDSCTLVPYTVPPATVDHYALAPPWALVLVAIVVVLVIVTTAIVRYKAHAERGLTQRAAIDNPPRHCPTCGWDFGEEES